MDPPVRGQWVLFTAVTFAAMRFPALMRCSSVRHLCTAPRLALPELPDGSRRLYLVRHGETNWNVEQRIQGSTDKPLNETGLRQATDLAALLSPVPLSLICSSPLMRASETARCVHAFHPGAAWREEPRFAEMHFGEIEGRTLAEYAETYKATLAAWESGDTEVRWPGRGGESCQDVADRALEALEELLSEMRHRHICVVAHSRVNKSLLACLQGDLSRCSAVEQGNTCVNVLDVDAEGAWNVVLLDFREHVGRGEAWS